MLALPVAAVESAVRAICCNPPGATDKVIGVAVMPLGNVPTVRFTFPVNPFTGEAVTVIACGEPPEVTVTVEGATAKVKSAGNVAVWPPPQPAKTVSTQSADNKLTGDCMGRLPKLLFFRLAENYWHALRAALLQ